MKLTRIFNEFFESEKAAGLILICCTIFSLTIANSGLGEIYHQFWNQELGGHSFEYWINDALMAIFFLMIGLELEREVYAGELSKIKNALLPVLAAVGGMIVPACIHYFFNSGATTQSGAGIPMATDIAFALGVLSLAGKRVPPALKVFLTALAVIDDLGAIFTIAVFYSDSLNWAQLIYALCIFLSLLLMNRLNIRNVFFYLLPGIFMWYIMSKSGVHPSISGVLLAFAIPFGKGDSKSTSYILQHILHKPVAYIILPLFALCNTAIQFNETGIALVNSNSLGIFFGLVLGKVIGICLFTFIAVKLKICHLPDSITSYHILGAGFLGGIGFTMSIFITLLAFNSPEIIDNSKLTILFSSLISAIVGLIILILKKRSAETV